MEFLWIFGYQKRIRVFLAIVFDYQSLTYLINFERFLKFRTKKFDYQRLYEFNRFVRQILQQKHCFKDVCPSLKACMVTSEMLFEGIKLCKKAGYSNYQRIWCIRTRLNRFSKPRWRMAVNADFVFVEILDENGVVPPYEAEL
jgi:phenylacetate-CoA ligase